VSTEPHRVQARSFGKVAGTYAEHRPGYPVEAVRWLLAAAPGRRVLDLAAGTGKLTRAVVAAGAEVTAVEPLEPMLEQLRAAVPEAEALEGSAERIPVADRSVDLVTVGQAFHWFDQEAALAEIRRVLRPRGVVGLLANARDDAEPWVAEMLAIDGGGDRLSQVATDRWRALEADPAFDRLERRDFPNPTAFTAERLTGFAASTSGVSTLRRLGELARSHPALTGRATFAMPFVTVAVRSALVPAG
jgi:SAM-dependent methyltransferase